MPRPGDKKIAGGGAALAEGLPDLFLSFSPPPPPLPPALHPSIHPPTIIYLFLSLLLTLCLSPSRGRPLLVEEASLSSPGEWQDATCLRPCASRAPLPSLPSQPAPLASLSPPSASPRRPCATGGRPSHSVAGRRRRTGPFRGGAGGRGGRGGGWGDLVGGAVRVDPDAAQRPRPTPGERQRPTANPTSSLS